MFPAVVDTLTPHPDGNRSRPHPESGESYRVWRKLIREEALWIISIVAVACCELPGGEVAQLLDEICDARRCSDMCSINCDVRRARLRPFCSV